MKDLYLEITFWIGASTVLALITIVAFKLWEIVLNFIGDHIKFCWNMYEYMFYKKEFKKWIEENKKDRHPKSKK